MSEIKQINGHPLKDETARKNALCIDSQSLFSDSEYYVKPNEMVYVIPATESAEIFIDIVSTDGSTITKSMGSHITCVMLSNTRSCFAYNLAVTPTPFNLGIGNNDQVKIRCTIGCGVHKITTQKMLEG